MSLDLSLVGVWSPAETFTYTWKDVVLYALGVGAKKGELDFLYEGRGPKVLPSFAVVPMFGPMFNLLAKTGGDLSMVVHGGQRVRVHGALPPAATVETSAQIKGIYDMRKFAIVAIETRVTHEGKLLAETSSNIIFRGAGGFGGKTPPKEEKMVELPKDRPGDFRIEEVIPEEQALLYRLSGDLNPLHADPAFAASVGFERAPILHGLCTYGMMVRHAALGAAGGDATKLKAFDAQFRKPVWPGDTLVTEGYRVDGDRLALRVTVKERAEAVLTGAWAQL
jgi:acyl dehydratase